MGEQDWVAAYVEAAERKPIARYSIAIALVAATTALARGIQALYPMPDLQMLYLLAVMVAAWRLGRGPSIVTAALSVAAYDFFFVPPHLTFAVHDVRYALSFVMMFVVGFTLSALVTRIRTAALRARTEELRSSLLSAVSHDLRTPLAVITGNTSVLRDGRDLSEAARAELLDTIGDEADRLAHLVTNLLDMTRLTTGGMEPKREWVPLEEVVGSALTSLEAKLARRPITTTLPAELPLLSVDPVLFHQVFVNLLENARKYTPADSPIEICARVVTAGRIQIDFSDRGPGIPEQDLERVFEKFQRGDHTAVGGVGLGLSICRGIVEAHGGTLRVENREGGGARFRIELPSAGPPPQGPASHD